MREVFVLWRPRTVRIGLVNIDYVLHNACVAKCGHHVRIAESGLTRVTLIFIISLIV